MDLWRSFDLTPKTIRQFASNTHLLQNMLANKETVELFFNRFPFEKLLNITVMDSYSLTLCVRILDLLSDYKEFYSYDGPCNYSMEFILINLSQMTKDCNEIVSLFQLLSKILHSNKKTVDDSFKNIFDRERILEVMLKIANFGNIDKNKFLHYGPILHYLLQLSFPNSINLVISELFDKLKKHEALKEMSMICKHTLNRSKFLSDSFKNIRSWLIDECPVILTEHCDEALLLEITQCLSFFTMNYEYHESKKNCPELSEHAHQLYKNLLKVTSDICLHTSNPQLRPNCFKLLEFLLVQFAEEEKIVSFTKPQLSQQLGELPEDVEQWAGSDVDVFLCICHIAVWYSRMLWKNKDVLHFIIRCFYNKKHIINTHVFKSIYFLYPILMASDINDEETVKYYSKTLGNDLLSYFLKFCHISQLYSYNSHQLNWMLTEGSKRLKLTVLYQWMHTIENEEVLAGAIQACKAEVSILELILDSTLKQKMGPKLSLILRKIQNPLLSKKIALMLPLTIDKAEIFQNLLLAQPAIPLDSSDCILLSTLMGAIIPTLNDSEVLKCACIFSSKLLASLKDNPNVIMEFCKNISNIRYLIRTMKQVDEDTSIEIIRLLKVIVIVQQRSKVKMVVNVQDDFKIFMTGSLEMTEKSLKLLYHIMACKWPVVTIEEQYIPGIYYAVLDYTENPKLRDLAYDCVVMMLRRLPELAQTLDSVIHIEMSCLSIYDKSHTRSFLKMLDIWLRVIKRDRLSEFCPIPQAALKNFLLRTSSAKSQQYLSILDDLIKRQDRKLSNVFDVVLQQ